MKFLILFQLCLSIAVFAQEADPKKADKETSKAAVKETSKTAAKETSKAAAKETSKAADKETDKTNGPETETKPGTKLSDTDLDAFLKRVHSRGPMMPGHPGNMALAEDVSTAFKDSGFKNGTIDFKAPIFHPGKVTMRFPGQTVKLHSLHPSMVRPGNFKTSAFESQLAYFGDGTVKALRKLNGINLKGKIGGFDYASGDKWMELMRFGLKGVIFLDAEKITYQQTLSKLHNTDVSVPRYFVKIADVPAVMKAAINNQKISIKVGEVAHYKNDLLKDYWVFIPGKGILKTDYVVVITARMDANSLVPDLAQGAQNTPNIFMLLKLLKQFKKNKPDYSVMLTASNAYTQDYKGERHVAWYLLSPSWKIEQTRNTVSDKLRISKLYYDNYTKLTLPAYDKNDPLMYAMIEMMYKLDAKQMAIRQKKFEVTYETWKLTRAKDEDEFQDRLKKYNKEIKDLLTAWKKERKDLHTELMTLEKAKPHLESKIADWQKKCDALNQTLDGLKEPDLEEPKNIKVKRPVLNKVLDLSKFTDAEFKVAAEELVVKCSDDWKNWKRFVSTNKDAKALLKSRLDNAIELAAKSTDHHKKFANELKALFDDEKLFESWRGKVDSSTGSRIPIKELLQKASMRKLNEHKLKMLSIADRAVNDKTTVDKDKIKALKKEKDQFSQVLIMFNKVDLGIASRVYYRDIATNPIQHKILKDFKDEIIEQLEADISEYKEWMARSDRNSEIKRVIGRKTVKLLINLELNYQSIGFGFMKGTRLNLLDMKKFGERTVEIAKTVDAKYNPFADTMTLKNTWPETFHFTSLDSANTIYQCSGYAAIALQNTHAQPGRSFSPDDRPKFLNQKRIIKQQKWLLSFLNKLINDPEIDASFLSTFNTGGNYIWSTYIRTLKQDEFGGSLKPDMPVPNTLIGFYTQMQQQGDLFNKKMSGDVARVQTEISGHSGHVYAIGLNHSGFRAPAAFTLAENQRTIIMSINKGRIQTSEQMPTKLGGQTSITLPMFKAREIVIYNRLDSSRTGTSPSYIDTYRVYVGGNKQSIPQIYGTLGFSPDTLILTHTGFGPVSILMRDKGKNFTNENMVLLSDSQLLINASDEHPDGWGYANGHELGSDFSYASARDLYQLNTHRLKQLKGVSNELIKDFIDRGSAELKTMEKLQAENDHVGYLVSNYKALGLLNKAYYQIQGINQDMLKAIIFYMGLMLPFCFFLQKLLFKFTKLEHEVLAISTLFCSLYLCFRFIHPAFAIALSPEAIFIAFVLLAIGVFVTTIMHGRFTAEMQVIFRNITGANTNNVGVGMVGQTALLIGVNNMKRRRTRTVLTTGTIILITFAILTFSSVSKKMNPQLINKSDKAAYNGIFYMNPGGSKIDSYTLDIFNNFYNQDELINVRWLKHPGKTASEIWPLVYADRKPIDIMGLIGFQTNEEAFTGTVPLIAGRWFSDDQANEIILSSESCDALNIQAKDLEGDEIVLKFHGHKLKLVGIMNGLRYQQIRDLNPYIPLIPKSLVKAPGTTAADENEESESDTTARTIDVATMAFIPAGLAKTLGAAPYTISVKFKEDDSLWERMNSLLEISSAKFYLASKTKFEITQTAEEIKRKLPVQTIKAGTYYVGSSYKTSMGGLSQLFIPLLIAGSIILNTMLGTVYERKGEIAVYNAIGLNPTHIFLFFLAEALVYSVIGSVRGYLIGQFLAIFIQITGLIPGLNINFSSLMVVYAITFTISLVLLSTIYPGLVATRTAVPSGKRKWSMPENDGDNMTVMFPFIYQKQIVNGIIFYLYEFFAQFDSQSIGDFIAKFEGLEESTDEKGRVIFKLKYNVALAPYDLGVTQNICFVTQFDEEVDSFRVHMEVERVSGQDSNWVTTNKPFLELLRRLLMQWRNMDNALHQWYVTQANALIKGEELPDIEKPEKIEDYQLAMQKPKKDDDTETELEVGLDEAQET